MLRRLSRTGKDTTKDDDDAKSDTSRSTPPPNNKRDSLSRSMLRKGSMPRKGSQATNPTFEGEADDDKRSSMPRRKGSQVARNPSFVADKSVASSSTHSSMTRNLSSRVGRMFGRSTAASSAGSAAAQDAEINRVSRELTASKAASAKQSSGGYESRVPTGNEADLQKATRDLKDKYRKTLEDESSASTKKKGSMPADKTLPKSAKSSRSKSPSARGLLVRRSKKNAAESASQSSINTTKSSNRSSKKKSSGSSKSNAKREAKELELRKKQRKAMPYPGVMDLTYLGPKETFLANLGRNPNNLDFGDGPRMIQSKA